jgi:hypothetical protein
MSTRLPAPSVSVAVLHPALQDVAHDRACPVGLQVEVQETRARHFHAIDPCESVFRQVVAYRFGDLAGVAPRLLG